MVGLSCHVGSSRAPSWSGHGRAGVTGSRPSLMGFPMTARPTPAFPKSPLPLPAPDGTDRGSLGCGRLRPGRATMAGKPNTLRCAIYTRKSTERGLELEFNSLDAQREACEAYIKSQASQ